MKATIKGPRKSISINLKNDLGLVVRQSATGKLFLSISQESYREILANVMLQGLSLADFGVTDTPNFQANGPNADTDEITIS